MEGICEGVLLKDNSWHFCQKFYEILSTDNVASIWHAYQHADGCLVA
jgi:hypothetical protein